MKERILTIERINAFKLFLQNEEKSTNTQEKYVRDVRAFAKAIGEKRVTKEVVIEYKAKLVTDKYAVRSINSMLASLNSFFTFQGWFECKVKFIKMQRQVFCPEEKELTKDEYMRLVNTAKSEGNERLNLILQTICATGIRVSELEYITVDAVKKGEARVLLKGKNRTVFIVSELRNKLLKYAKKKKITSGLIFITSTGKKISHSNIWREMKSLCDRANVNPKKVFPHNLRHLFARTFYSIQKDIAKLADVLGHSSINTTRIYIMTSGNEHRQCVERLRLII